MGNLNKMLSMPTAIGKKTKFNRSSITVTTNDFFALKPVYCREIIPNQSTKIDMSMFCRMASMPNPAYARIKFVNRAFFVRYDSIWRGFSDFLSQTKASNGVIPDSVPSVSQKELFGLFIEDSSGEEIFCSEVESTDTYDFTVIDNGTELYYKLTKRGKVVFDTLINLGYNLPRLFDLNQTNWDCKYSAMPLLAYAKVWYDWFRNNKYEPILKNIGSLLNSFFDENEYYYLSRLQLLDIFELITRVSYDVDYFTAASKNSVTPNIDEPSQSIKDITMTGSNSDRASVNSGLDGNENTQGTPYYENVSNLKLLTDYMLKALNKMTDYMVRDGLVGGKKLDRLLAHYGVRVPSIMLNRSVYIGKYEQPLTIMDVTQTSGSVDPSDTSFTQLGYQGGRGLTTDISNGHFEYETGNDIFGQIIVISQIVPEISYYQGVKREMFHLGRFDFFTPEYDSLGQQLMMKAEVYNGVSQFDSIDNDTLLSDNSYDEGFGFIDRYAEYKQSDNQDVLSGDFRVKSAGQSELQSYQLFRQIYPKSFKDNSDLVTNIDFDHVNSDIEQYDRMFDWKDSFDDHFITFYDFQVVDYMPMKPLFESYDFGDDEEHNLRVKVNKNGTMF